MEIAKSPGSGDRQRWLATGCSDKERLAWEAAGFDVAAARRWRSAGFSPEVAKAWGATTGMPRTAELFEIFGLTPAEAAPWLARRVLSTDALLFEMFGWLPDEAPERYEVITYAGDETPGAGLCILAGRYGVPPDSRPLCTFARNWAAGFLTDSQASLALHLGIAEVLDQATAASPLPRLDALIDCYVAGAADPVAWAELAGAEGFGCTHPWVLARILFENAQQWHPLVSAGYVGLGQAIELAAAGGPRR